MTLDELLCHLHERICDLFDIIHDRNCDIIVLSLVVFSYIEAEVFGASGGSRKSVDEDLEEDVSNFRIGSSIRDASQKVYRMPFRVIG